MTTVHKKRAILALLATFLIWGVSFPIIKLIISEIPPFIFAFLRFTLASLLLVPAFIFDDAHHPIKFADLPRMIIIAILGPTLTNVLVYFGIGASSATDAAVIHSLFPVSMAISGILFLGEKLKKNIIIGVLFATFGGLILVGQPFFDIDQKLTSQSIFGNILILVSVVTWTAYTIGSKELFDRYSYVTITAFSFLTGMIAVAPFAVLEHFKNPNWHLNLSSDVIIGFIFMIIFSSIVAYLLYEWSLKLVSAQIVGVISHTQIIWAIVGSYFILREFISILFVAGALLILVGVYVTTWGIPHYHLHRGHKI